MSNQNQLKRIGDFLASVQDAQESQAFILEAQSSASGMGDNATCTNRSKAGCTGKNNECINYGDACADTTNSKCESRLPITVDPNFLTNCTANGKTCK